MGRRKPFQQMALKQMDIHMQGEKKVTGSYFALVGRKKFSILLGSLTDLRITLMRIT